MATALAQRGDKHAVALDAVAPVDAVAVDGGHAGLPDLDRARGVFQANGEFDVGVPLVLEVVIEGIAGRERI